MAMPAAPLRATRPSAPFHANGSWSDLGCQTSSVGLTFERVSTAETDAVVGFLSGSDWPFHSAPRLSVAEAGTISIANAETRSFWIRDAGSVVGLVRLLDLDDIDDGSPLFDLRIASGSRGQGFGTAAVKDRKSACRERV